MTGGYALYPMAEVLGVYNAATKAVDGQLTLAPNTVAWAANDPVEEPHYFQELVAADTDVCGADDAAAEHGTSVRACSTRATTGRG